MPKVRVKVEARRFIPGTVKTEDFQFYDYVELDTPSKLSLFRGCARAFGKCSGSIHDKDTGAQVGWAFEGKSKEPGDVLWWETRVLPVYGTHQVGQFVLGKGK